MFSNVGDTQYRGRCSVPWEMLSTVEMFSTTEEGDIKAYRRYYWFVETELVKHVVQTEADVGLLNKMIVRLSSVRRI